jgi:predicted amidohydrolase
MQPITAAVVQLTSQADVDANLARAGELTAAARAAGATLVVLPENFAFMGGEEAEKRKLAESADGGGKIVEFLRRTAKQHGIFLIGGGFPERSDDPDRPFNTSLLAGPDGNVVAAYRKIHLFDVDLPDGTSLKESSASKAGSAPVVCDVGVPLGMTICYDVRFPELYRALMRKGARIVTVPAAFTLTTGKDHWHALLRARAIEDQVFVLAAAQTGKHPRGRQTYGKSIIVDPWGDVLAQAGEGEGFAVARLDFAYQDRVRAALPSLQHVRLD